MTLDAALLEKIREGRRDLVRAAWRVARRSPPYAV
jgi:hypothetical protein